MKFFARLGCIAGKHERSRGNAREVDGRIESVCRHCGVAMQRDSVTRVWSVKAR